MRAFSQHLESNSCSTPSAGPPVTPNSPTFNPGSCACRRPHRTAGDRTGHRQSSVSPGAAFFGRLEDEMPAPIESAVGFASARYFAAATASHVATCPHACIFRVRRASLERVGFLDIGNAIISRANRPRALILRAAMCPPRPVPPSPRVTRAPSESLAATSHWCGFLRSAAPMGMKSRRICWIRHETGRRGRSMAVFFELEAVGICYAH